MNDTTKELQPHQLRVIDEKNELDNKLKKLNEFRGTETFRALDGVDRRLLEVQAEAMTKYSYTLGQRIARF